jgi:hypothetical protein
MPEDSIIAYKKGGSYALFANLFRYEILRAGLGLYVDCDVYCVRPIKDASYIFGWESGKLINNAILKLPQDCPVLHDLCRIKEPAWAVEQHRKLPLRKRLFRAAPSIAEMPWGTTGPKALTSYTRKHGMQDLVSPPDIFYPVSPIQIQLLADPGLTLEELITSRTRAVHFYMEMIKRAGITDFPPKSPLGRIIAEEQ